MFSTNQKTQGNGFWKWGLSIEWDMSMREVIIKGSVHDNDSGPIIWRRTNKGIWDEYSNIYYGDFQTYHSYASFCLKIVTVTLCFVISVKPSVQPSKRVLTLMNMLYYVVITRVLNELIRFLNTDVFLDG